MEKDYDNSFWEFRNWTDVLERTRPRMTEVSVDSKVKKKEESLDPSDRDNRTETRTPMGKRTPGRGVYVRERRWVYKKIGMKQLKVSTRVLSN